MASDTHAGQAVYGNLTLKVYDWYVLGLSNRLAWRCPVSEVIALYDANLAPRHLDVGVGTGYHLDRAHTHADQSIALLDLNDKSLGHTARRIARYQPVTYRRDVLEPIELVRPDGTAEAPFGSIGMSYLLHCLPGPMANKARAFDHLLPHLGDDGVLFGATILGRGVTANRLARTLMKIYNRKGIFGNEDDGLDELRAQLGRRFGRVDIAMRGCVALFSAREPVRRDDRDDATV